MLSQEQIEGFHRDGFLVMRQVFHGRELELLQKATEPVIAEGIAGQGSDHGYQVHPQTGETTYWRTNNMWTRGDIFQAVTLNPDLLENIGQCIGHPFYPSDDALVVKQAGAGAPVVWHQDPPYGDPAIATTHPIPNFVADIYLDHSGTDNGCVWAIPGHHLVGHVDLPSKTQEQLFTECGAVPVEMEAGDVLFHSLSIPHGSRATLGDSGQRRVFYIHYLADEVFRDLYLPVWERIHPGKPAGITVAREMLVGMTERRRALGFPMPDDRDTLRIDADGISFTGTPRAPSYHWGERIRALDEEQRRAMKRLQAR